MYSKDIRNCNTKHVNIEGKYNEHNNLNDENSETNSHSKDKKQFTLIYRRLMVYIKAQL